VVTTPTPSTAVTPPWETPNPNLYTHTGYNNATAIKTARQTFMTKVIAALKGITSTTGQSFQTFIGGDMTNFINSTGGYDSSSAGVYKMLQNIITFANTTQNLGKKNLQDVGPKVIDAVTGQKTLPSGSITTYFQGFGFQPHDNPLPHGTARTTQLNTANSTAQTALSGYLNKVAQNFIS
jgi:hypothetical protein